jgi:hypothetical protein
LRQAAMEEDPKEIVIPPALAFWSAAIRQLPDRF